MTARGAGSVLGSFVSQPAQISCETFFVVVPSLHSSPLLRSEAD